MARPKKIADEDFLRVWETAPTATEAARLLGLGLTAASNRATRMRDAGIPAKKYPVGCKRSPETVASLRKLVLALREGAR